MFPMANAMNTADKPTRSYIKLVKNDPSVNRLDTKL